VRLGRPESLAKCEPFFSSPPGGGFPGAFCVGAFLSIGCDASCFEMSWNPSQIVMLLRGLVRRCGRSPHSTSRRFHHSPDSPPKLEGWTQSNPPRRNRMTGGRSTMPCNEVCGSHRFYRGLGVLSTFLSLLSLHAVRPRSSLNKSYARFVTPVRRSASHHFFASATAVLVKPVRLLTLRYSSNVSVIAFFFVPSRFHPCPVGSSPDLTRDFSDTNFLNSRPFPSPWGRALSQPFGVFSLS